jgi:CDP-diacylglycerol pyrophosphatase
MSVQQVHRLRVLSAVTLCLIVGFFIAHHFFGLFETRDALWKIAHDKCVADAVSHHDPKPCALVDIAGGEAKGYVILKDLHGVAQFLLIPTQRISGIESGDLLAAGSPNYWAAAWNNRRFVSMRLKRDVAWDKIGLAINSSTARSQDQLHIHIDCVRPDVRAALAAHMNEIGTKWAPLTFDLVGHRYVARRLAAADLAIEDPFKLLADEWPSAKENMAQETLAVIGVAFGQSENGFVLLARRAEPAAPVGAHSEELLDRSCAVARAH